MQLCCIVLFIPPWSAKPWRYLRTALNWGRLKREESRAKQPTEMLSISIDSLSSSSSCNGSSNEQLSFVRVDSGNLAQFRAQNTILFPVQYPDKFYSSILAYDTVKAFLGKTGHWLDAIAG